MVTDAKRCVIVAASPDCDDDFIGKFIQDDDYVICADAGFDKLLNTNIIPDLIAGDFDSSKKLGMFDQVPTIRLPVQKDDTDTMYCVKTALEKGFKRVVILGAIGGRFDHTLANLSCLLYMQSAGAAGRIVDGINDIRLLDKGLNVYRGVLGKTVSVIPFGCSEAVLSYEGLFYKLEKGRVGIDYPYTVSNYAAEDEIKIHLHSGTALIIFVG